MTFVSLGILNSQKTGVIPAPDFFVSAPLWLDASDTSTITESGGSVSQWDNKGTLENFTQPTSSFQPGTGSITKNGLNVLEFSGDFLTGSTASNWKFMHDGTTYFIAFVAQFGFSSNPSTDYRILGTNAANSSNVGFQYKYDDTIENNELDFAIAIGSSGNFAARVTDGSFLTPDTFLLPSLLTNPDNPTVADRINYFVNNTEGTNNNSSGNNPNSSNPTYILQVGAGGNNATPLTGYIAELVVVSGADATEENRQAAVNYLNEKWGVF